MESLERDEFKALRATIRERGTARVWMFVIILGAWAALTVVVTAAVPLPVVALVPLLLLVGGFEAINVTHVGVERIGRYLQVFYEPEAAANPPAEASNPAGPRWEQIAMAYGRGFRGGGGIDALFAPVFAAATLLNLIPVLLPEPTPRELVAIGAAHLLFLVRILVARQQSGRQRAQDLERFRSLRDKT